ncbi:MULTISPECIES: NupC/NupG family nucleoside CNT transporter [unclassified Brevundimonas]|uniref:NupC/NupG family nucleoside CNT transporter n=1 Tax=unclassified Brevundimonas TaxID=2622653 RepID=UPI000CFBC458|nr:MULTISPECIES: nucleoside transporter C-terminal domain-containing protein [unclassified Brevundimonas]PRA29995.1 Na+ dependent nucleoside transporter [Brevundimonas sp. MYb27]PQZ80847.1 Na+ dependent nucleoside transporter [Brevundimonas sp. MYb31]PRB14052.1 Na+ dependent nucleoside transporter [Brevundimonas sp. MYb52]PRB33317.1 Na+ dependent nucleoside transporter [Brevundimonas sp. MYb46]PRB50809.1 Na+ dependent nucleoside transporter [Brevundimonas sp. MYb33]
MFSLLNLQSLLGLVVIIAVCWGLSENRKLFPWRLAIGAVLVQAALILATFAIPGSQVVLDGVNNAVKGLEVATEEGTKFVFGYLAGGDQPYAVANEGALFTFAFKVLPLILVISALSALLWHWKILKWITLGFGFVFQKTMGLGGASALAVAANVFLGMIESPIVIRAYLDKLTRSEVFLMMVVGLATVAGSTMVAYATILAPVLTNAAGHVLVASIVSAPAGVLLARVIIPEKPGEGGAVADYNSALKYDSAVDAIVKGTSDGLMVVLNISAVLIVFVALVALANVMLGAFWIGGEPLSVERVLGVVFSPLAWLIGVEWADAQKAGWLLGVKLTLTEFVAFIKLGAVPDGEMTERTRMLMTYALCGFANIGSVGITVTGLSVLMPERREEVLGLVWKALLAGFLATLMTACIVGAMPASVFGQ